MLLQIKLNLGNQLENYIQIKMLKIDFGKFQNETDEVGSEGIKDREQLIRNGLIIGGKWKLRTDISIPQLNFILN